MTRTAFRETRVPIENAFNFFYKIVFGGKKIRLNVPQLKSQREDIIIIEATVTSSNFSSKMMRYCLQADTNFNFMNLRCQRRKLS